MKRLAGTITIVSIIIFLLQTVVKTENLSVSPLFPQLLPSLSPFPQSSPHMPTSDPYDDAFLHPQEILKEVCVQECNKKLGLNFSSCIEYCKKNINVFMYRSYSNGGIDP